MLSNYLKSAWRNLLRSKGFSLINISGLAIGMAGAIFILLWITHEISFDRFHRHSDRLYEMYGLTTVDQRLSVITLTEQALAPALKKDFPEVEGAARIANIGNFLLTAGNSRFTGIKGNFADPAFLELFDFPVLKGKALFKDLHSIIITEKLAKQLFGNEEALNKLVRVNNEAFFTVTGILKDLPANTRFDFQYLLPWKYLEKLEGTTDGWMTNNISTFVLLKPHSNVQAFNAKVKDIARVYTGRPDIWTHFAFPLKQWHLYTSFENGQPTGGRIETVKLFGIIAALILLVACINFVNLSTAHSEKRAREVGIRKVAGARRSWLIIQFMTEAILSTMIAGGIALLIVQVTLPYFNTLVNADLTIPYDTPVFWISAAGFISLTALLSGAYPAFYLSAFPPAGILKGTFQQQGSAFSPRKTLVTIQFTFATVLIISTIIIKNQINYTQHRITGYAGNNLIYVNFNGDIEKNYALIKKELLNEGIATAITKTMAPVTERGSNTWALSWQGKPADFDETIALFSSDANLVKTAGLQLIAGRDINIEQYPGDSLSVLLNETAVKTMGFKDPVGQLITEPSQGRSWRVAGVVKDYVIGSPYNKIPPVVIQGPASWFGTMHIKFNNSASTAENLKKTAAIFQKYNPAYPFDYRFIDEQYAAKFGAEQRTKALAGLFAFLAILISCLGLLGLSAHMAESRMKEIGVRKILGASVTDIVKLLTFHYLKLVIIAVVLAIPIAGWVMSIWLKNFAYHTNISWTVFAISGMLSLVIAILTLSFEVVKAANRLPVKSLKE